jgi:hypothetical protein
VTIEGTDDKSLTRHLSRGVTVIDQALVRAMAQPERRAAAISALKEALQTQRISPGISDRAGLAAAIESAKTG